MGRLLLSSAIFLHLLCDLSKASHLYQGIIFPQCNTYLLDSNSCLGDGLQLANGSCLCQQYRSGDACEVRRCLNLGFVDQSERKIGGCVCPLGFVGANCEPGL